MIRIVFALALLAAFGRDATAQQAPNAPALKELVTVTADVVRVGDLVENAGAMANVAIFRAPDLGQTGTVEVARIAEALKPHDIAGLDTKGLSEVIVTRLSRVVTGKDIEERIARALGGQYNFGDARNITMQFDRELRSLHVEASAVADLIITRINVDQRSGRFDVTLDIPGSAVARRLPLRFTGIATETLETATLTRNVVRGDVIRESDVMIERRPKAEMSTGAVGLDEAVGLSVKRPLRAGQALRMNDLAKNDVIGRNEPVTIVYEVPGILLTVRGKALEAGAVGEMISVLNIQSNRTVHASVTGPGQVTAIAGAGRVAATLASAADNRRRRAQ